MLHTEKLKSLQQKLQMWNSHNEVHAKPADKILYEFLNELINTLHEAAKSEDQSSEPETPAQSTSADEGFDDGGNNPSVPDIP